MCIKDGISFLYVYSLMVFGQGVILILWFVEFWDYCDYIWNFQLKIFLVVEW